MSEIELKQHVALFLSKHYPADGNYNEPCSVVPNRAIKMFADYIATRQHDQRVIEKIEALVEADMSPDVGSFAKEVIAILKEAGE